MAGIRFETVFCVDINANMSSCIDFVKDCMCQWFDKITEEFGRNVYDALTSFNVKIITYTNSQIPNLTESKWFEISNIAGLEPEYFRAYLKRIKCAESVGEALAYEAINKALRVDWSSEKNA